MKTKTTTISKAILALALLTICTMVNAQIKYDSKGNLTIGDLTPYKFYSQTILSNGVYLTGLSCLIMDKLLDRDWMLFLALASE